MTILSNHKINTYLLKATRNEDLVAEMVSQSYKAAPTRDILEAKFGKVFLKMFKTKSRKVFRILG